MNLGCHVRPGANAFEARGDDLIDGAACVDHREALRPDIVAELNFDNFWRRIGDIAAAGGNGKCSIR